MNNRKIASELLKLAKVLVENEKVKTAYQKVDVITIYKEHRKKGKSPEEAAEIAIDAVLGGMGVVLSKSKMDEMIQNIIKKAE